MFSVVFSESDVLKGGPTSNFLSQKYYVLKFSTGVGLYPYSHLEVCVCGWGVFLVVTMARGIYWWLSARVPKLSAMWGVSCTMMSFLILNVNSISLGVHCEASP